MQLTFTAARAEMPTGVGEGALPRGRIRRSMGQSLLGARCYQRRRRLQRPGTQTQRQRRSLQTHRPGIQTYPRRARGLRSKRARGAGGRRRPGRSGRPGPPGPPGRPGRSGRPGRPGWASTSVDAEIPTAAAATAPTIQFRNFRRDSMSISICRTTGRELALQAQACSSLATTG